MTFVTKDKSGWKVQIRRDRKKVGMAPNYSGESVSASSAFRLEIVTVRPSI